MIIMPLGVASATPTATRHLPSVAVWREGSIFLFDCGENTQMRMLQAGMKRSKIDYIFISHLDGDHLYGLMGLLTTFQLQRREKKLTIVGPEKIDDFVKNTLDICDIEPTYEIDYKLISDDLEHDIVLDENDFFVEARPLKHNRFCIGYRLQEKDKPGKVDAEKAEAMGITEDAQYKELKAGNDVTLDDGSVVKSADIVGDPREGHSFTYITDTVFCENAIRLAEKATVLYHEATFGQNLKDKAKETGHSTAQEAAVVAKTADVKRLVITHFSARYTNQFVLLKEARNVFEETWLATELRPIMTDPEQEKGIFRPRVELVDLKQKPKIQKKKPQKGGKRFKKRIPSKGKGRQRYQKVRGGPGGKPSRPSRSDRPDNRDRDRDRDRERDYQRQDTRRRDDRRDDRRDSRRDDRGKSGKPRKPIPITPRTPFDDIDRL